MRWTFEQIHLYRAEHFNEFPILSGEKLQIYFLHLEQTIFT